MTYHAMRMQLSWVRLHTLHALCKQSFTVQLLPAVYLAGYEPCNMNEGLLVPVHKRGNLSQPNS
jgi:hypothetical protein